jgi:hypothetical protein
VSGEILAIQFESISLVRFSFLPSLHRNLIERFLSAEERDGEREREQRIGASERERERGREGGKERSMRGQGRTYDLIRQMVF